ncbi:MAG: hypothetical protein JO142_04215, partial [Burkholderiales bacterium]|nr:hypothetical protein [Burkholderiales bacterium]
MSHTAIDTTRKPLPLKVPLGIFAILIAFVVVGGAKALVFSLLIGLMMTGMPISIALGLTVLTFMFTMTTLPMEQVAQ